MKKSYAKEDVNCAAAAEELEKQKNQRSHPNPIYCCCCWSSCCCSLPPLALEAPLAALRAAA